MDLEEYYQKKNWKKREYTIIIKENKQKLKKSREILFIINT